MSTRAVRVNLCLPALRMGLGPFSFDPLEHLVGAKVSDLLAPLMVGPVAQRFIAGVAIDVYPLALPDGEGATVPLGTLGELGVFNAGGILILTVPAVAGPWVASRFGDAVESVPEPGPSMDGRSRVTNLRVRLRSGSRAAFPLGGLGEIGIEAG